MKRRAAACGVGALLLLALAVAGCAPGRAQPAGEWREVFAGVTYVRDVRQTPRRLVIHVLKIDLEAPGIRFWVTPPEPAEGRQHLARTTSQFLERHGLQAAINAGFFTPFYSWGKRNYYPRAGEPVDVLGEAVAGGQAYGSEDEAFPTLYFTRDNRVIFTRPAEGELEHAVSGNHVILWGGEIQPLRSRHARPDERHPRTAVGVDANGRRVLLAVVDGRQAGYSEGVTVWELAEILRQHGAAAALNLDGGGSTTMVMEGEDGAAVVLNSPIDQGEAGRERAVANHLGVWAQRGR